MEKLQYLKTECQILISDLHKKQVAFLDCSLFSARGDCRKLPESLWSLSEMLFLWQVQLAASIQLVLDKWQ
jgi:hypothetical protein